VNIVHLPVLQVVLPLLAAPLCLLLRSAEACWRLALAISWISLACAVILLDHVSRLGPLRYALGGWPAPYGIAYVVDPCNAFFLLLVTLITAVVMLYARTSLLAELGAEQAYLAYALILLWLAGLLGILVTADAFNVFVFLEISSLASYVLVGQGAHRQALTASLQYLIMGTLGGTFILIAIGFLYAATGTLNMADLAARLPAAQGSRTVQVALAFFLVGVSLKLALFPLHLWLPNAYAQAPSVVSALLAATSTKVAIYVLLRFVFNVFGLSLTRHGLPLAPLLGLLAVAAIVAGSLTAIVQSDCKRLFAYSSIAQIGFIMLGVALFSQAGLMAALLYLFNHALAKGAVFLALGCVYYRLRSVQVEDMAGLGQRMPWTMAALVIAGLSLIGVPATAGFVGKWYLVLAMLEQGLWPLALLALGGSLLTAIYVGRVIETAYLKEPAAIHLTVREAPLSMLLPTWLLALANVYLGLHGGWPVQGALRAAAQLLVATP
jgi:multicomponent Na+:H+ antiporter subunit D